MKNQRQLLEALCALKADKHHKLDTDTIKHLDKAIELMRQQESNKSKTDATKYEVLKCIAVVLIKLPSLISLFNSFFDE